MPTVVEEKVCVCVCVCLYLGLKVLEPAVGLLLCRVRRGVVEGVEGIYCLLELWWNGCHLCVCACAGSEERKKKEGVSLQGSTGLECKCVCGSLLEAW